MGRRSRSVAVGRRTSPALSPAPNTAANSEPTPATSEEAIQAVYEDVVALASEPLLSEPLVSSVETITRQGVTYVTRQATHESVRTAELGILAEGLAAVREITSALEKGSAPAAARHEAEASHEHIRQALEIARAAVGREQPVPDIHMHMPEHRVDVNIEGTEITVPQPEVHFRAGDVIVPQAAPPQVDVFVPAQEPTVVNVAAAAPDIHVAAAAPDVHVHAAEPPANRGVRVEIDEHGQKVFVPVEIVP